MTYENEFEKIHYPIPLDLMSEPKPERMIRTIERMNTEINFFRSSNGFNMGETQEIASMKSSANSFYSEPNMDYERLMRDNEELRSQIDEIESVVQSMPGYFDYMRSKDPFDYEYQASDSESVNYKSPKVARTEPIDYKIDTQTSGFMPKDYVMLKDQVDELESVLNSEKQTNQTTIEEQTQQIETLRREAGDTKGEGGKMKHRVKELEAELKDSLRKLDLLQRGINPDKKTPTRKRYVSPGIKSNNSKKSVGRTKTNFLERNKRVSSLPGNKNRTPSYARPTRQYNNRHEVKNRSASNRLNSNNRSSNIYGNRKPGYISKGVSSGVRTNSGSAKRQNTKPQVSGVFGRLYQSKQRDSPLRTNNNTRVSPSYRPGGYKRSPATRFQRDGENEEGVKKRSPGTRVTSNFQVSSRLYPGPGGRPPAKESSNTRNDSNSKRNKSNDSGIYKSSYRNHSKDKFRSYGAYQRPQRTSGSREKSDSNTRDKTKGATSSAVFDRLYGNNGSKTRKTSKPKPPVSNRPPVKPVKNNYLDNSNNSDLEILKDKASKEENKEITERIRKENNFKAANSSLERRAAARENLERRTTVIEKELVRSKDPTPTFTSSTAKPADMNIEQRFNRIAELIKQGNADHF